MKKWMFSRLMFVDMRDTLVVIHPLQSGVSVDGEIIAERSGMLSNFRFFSRTLLFILVPAVAWIALGTHAIEFPESRKSNADANRADGLAAWEKVYSVLISPRCINCHTATDYPQQGDDRRRHFANVVRGGPEGKGVPALNCAGCHQEVNADSTGVPGSPNWHLAPLSMRWQDTDDQPLTSAAVCRAVTDRSRNHNMDGRALLKHNAEDKSILERRCFGYCVKS
jgi:hypothetical protein